MTKSRVLLVPSKIYPGDIPDIFFDFFNNFFLKIYPGYPGSKLVNVFKKIDGLYLLSFYKN